MGGTVAETAERYLTGRLTRGEIDKETARVYRRALEELVEVVGDKRAAKLTKRDAEAWLEATVPLAATTRRQRHGAVSRFCDWLVAEELLNRNPFVGVVPPKPARRPPKSLPHDAVARLLGVCDNSRDRLIVLLMVQQGLRCGGVANLLIEDVDLFGRSMRVREKFGHERVLPITDECFEALTRYLREHPASSGPLIRQWRSNGGYSWGGAELVAGEKGLRPSSLSTMLSTWMYEAGIKLAPGDGRSAHALRHTCATDMLADGADLMVVRDVLGHTSLATTQVYLSVQPDRLADAMNRRRYA